MNSWFFFKDVFRIVWYMLKTDGNQWQPRVWLSGLKFLLGKPGILRRGLFKYARFYRSSFHPWDHDNRKLIEKWLDKQPAAGQS